MASGQTGPDRPFFTGHWPLATGHCEDGNGDPRDFEDVVRRKGLTPEQLRRAGVAEGVARRAGGLGPPGR